ncbi:MAG: phage major capsid protein, P2 family [Agitococcus sp.]|nr:phage major capsid protein, P2 family [Agitococcus sp.]
MRTETSLAWDGFVAQVFKLNKITAGVKKFTVDPSVQQVLEDKIQEDNEFLTKINIVPVTEKQGQKLGLSIGGPIAKTTNTASQDRETSDPTNIDLEDEYDCTQTNYDTHVTYGKLDLWAKFKDFQLRLRNFIIKRQGLDRIMIGFNGVSRAATSNPTTHPLLQDVNIGWLQKIRTNAPQRWMSEGDNAGEIRVGSAVGSDYATLDALVQDMVDELIDPWFRDDTGLVVICGRKLLADKYFPMINTPNAPTEQIALNMLLSQKSLGGLQAVRVPFFPDNAMLVTRLDNLSIYWQEGSRRRLIVDNPKRDRIENYESSNDAYIVEDYGMAALAENIVYTDA